MRDFSLMEELPGQGNQERRSNNERHGESVGGAHHASG